MSFKSIDSVYRPRYRTSSCSALGNRSGKDDRSETSADCRSFFSSTQRKSGNGDEFKRHPVDSAYCTYPIESHPIPPHPISLMPPTPHPRSALIEASHKISKSSTIKSILDQMWTNKISSGFHTCTECNECGAGQSFKCPCAKKRYFGSVTFDDLIEFSKTGWGA